MTLQAVGPNIEIPALVLKGATSLSSSTPTIDAVGEAIHCIGQVVLEGGSAGGSKTISSAGGGISWQTATATWATAGSTVRVGLQDLSTTTAPAQGDGTFDVYKDLVQGTDAVAATTSYTTLMATGTKTLSHGDRVAIAFEMTVRNGADSVGTRHYLPAYASTAFNGSAVMLNTGSFARQASMPNVLITFDDGTLGWVSPSCPITLSSSIGFNSGTAGADEYGNIITPVAAMRANGVALNVMANGASSDFEVCLYSDPLGTPVLIEAITVDATQLAISAGAGGMNALFSTERTLSAGVAYGITVRPTSVNSVTLYFQDVVVAAHWKAISLDDTCYAIKRLDNTGAFSGYNGGTAKTRRMNISLLVDQFDDGAGGGGGGGMKQSYMNGNFLG